MLARKPEDEDEDENDSNFHSEKLGRSTMGKQVGDELEKREEERRVEEKLLSFSFFLLAYYVSTRDPFASKKEIRRGLYDLHTGLVAQVKPAFSAIR